jgi:hypothetical protein
MLTTRQNRQTLRVQTRGMQRAETSLPVIWELWHGSYLEN